MKTLYLLRHGKSTWDSPTLGDYERPLSPRGTRAAIAAGRHLAAARLRPNLILCSSAKRTRDTADLVLAEMTPVTAGTEKGAEPACVIPIETERGLYLCGSKALCERIRELPDRIDTVLLVGHNPDLHELALYLVGTGDAVALGHMRDKFPTAACATLEFNAERWRDIEPGSSRLADFEVPRKGERDD